MSIPLRLSRLRLYNEKRQAAAIKSMKKQGLQVILTGNRMVERQSIHQPGG